MTRVSIAIVVFAGVLTAACGGGNTYWHPHNYEVLSGTLRMPGLPDAPEKEALKTKVNSYGKTWHTWMTGVHGQQGDALPFGPPHLQWSFNRDGEANPDMVQARDSRMWSGSSDATHPIRRPVLSVVVTRHTIPHRPLIVVQRSRHRETDDGRLARLHGTGVDRRHGE
jgi:hypothetical protein